MKQLLSQSLSRDESDFVVLFNSKSVKNNYICIFSRLTAAVNHTRNLKISK